VPGTASGSAGRGSCGRCGPSRLARFNTAIFGLWCGAHSTWHTRCCTRSRCLVLCSSHAAAPRQKQPQCGTYICPPEPQAPALVIRVRRSVDRWGGSWIRFDPVWHLFVRRFLRFTEAQYVCIVLLSCPLCTVVDGHGLMLSVPLAHRREDVSDNATLWACHIHTPF
jgi:hypothetical protein